MVTKIQLGDCCGAQHINQFSYQGPSETAYVFGAGGFVVHGDYAAALLKPNNTLTRLPVRAASRGANTRVYELRSYAPGVTSAIITLEQNRLWGAWLVAHGFTLVVDNIKNRNTQSRLFFYLRVDNPYQDDSTRGLIGTVDGQAVRVRLKPDGTPYRVRNSAGVLVVPTLPPTAAPRRQPGEPHPLKVS